MRFSSSFSSCDTDASSSLQHLSGLHCYADNLKRAVSAYVLSLDRVLAPLRSSSSPRHSLPLVLDSHHFCSCARHDGERGKVRQCVIYDSDKADARLIGIEYVVDEEVFRNLPEDEKKYWHSRSLFLFLPRSSGC